MYTVLIADDEAIVRMMLSSMIDWDEMELKLAGCVSNGREALAYLEQQGFEVTYLSVDSQGHISLEELEAAGIQEGDTVRMYGLSFTYYK